MKHNRPETIGIGRNALNARAPPDHKPEMNGGGPLGPARRSQGTYPLCCGSGHIVWAHQCPLQCGRGPLQCGRVLSTGGGFPRHMCGYPLSYAGPPYIGGGAACVGRSGSTVRTLNYEAKMLRRVIQHPYNPSAPPPRIPSINPRTSTYHQSNNLHS